MEERVLLQSNCSLYRVTTKEELDTFSCGDKDLDDFFHRDEMKLHKLLYFTQRECLIQKGEPMFDAQFEAWKYGPVMVQIRQHYKNDSLPELMDKEQVVQYEPVFDMVFKTYAPQKSWSLRTLTHGEFSWKHAREGYDEQDSCEVEMKTASV